MFNRFVYVSTNPLRYTDPGGYCRYDSDGNFVWADDCTVQEWIDLDWAGWVEWMQGLIDRTDDTNFNAFRALLEARRSDFVLGGTAWFLTADAWALASIQDGYRMGFGEYSAPINDWSSGNNSGGA